MAGWIIIADDLTGAADSAVACAGRGIESVVLLRRKGADPPDPLSFGTAEVVAIDADTRRLEEKEAAAIVEQLVRSIGCDSAQTLLYKKVDSTLRGNVAAEFGAILSARREQVPDSKRVAVVFAPAFPALGRTTVHGRQLLHGQPLEADGNSPRNRLNSDIAGRLSAGGLSNAVVDLPRIRGDAAVLQKTMLQMTHEVDVIICDAETEDDLHAVAGAAMTLGKATVWAGSAGLARHIAGAAAFGCIPRGTANPGASPSPHGPTLFVIGSPAPESREQAQALAAAGDVACVTVPVFATLSADRPSELEEPELQERASRIIAHLAAGDDVLVRFHSAGPWTIEPGRLPVQSLAAMLAPCSALVGALFATGGETARAILDAWGIHRLTLKGEVEPGLPWSVADCAQRDICVLTKSGGFGSRETLFRCREFLRNLSGGRDVVEAQRMVPNKKS